MNARERIVRAIDDTWEGNPWAREAELPTKAADAVLAVLPELLTDNPATAKAAKTAWPDGYDAVLVAVAKALTEEQP